MKRFLLLPALLAMLQAGAQQIGEYRYWFNDDPGTITTVPIGPITNALLIADLPATGIMEDYNTITIQFRDTNDIYSVPLTSLFVRNTGAVTGYEYWIDDAIAGRVSETITAGTIVTIGEDIPLCLTAGTHLFTIRFASASGTWSVPFSQEFTSDASPDSDGDGLCDVLDPCPLAANAAPGQACDDNNASTTNDVIGEDCLCAGTPPPPLTLISSFDPSNAGGFCGVAYDADSARIWAYDCSAAIVQQYTTTGTFVRSITRPGESTNDVDLSMVPENVMLGNAAVPYGRLLFINGESGTADIYAVEQGPGTVITSLATAFGLNHVVGGAYHPMRDTYFLVQDDDANAADENRVAEIDPVTGAVLNTFQFTGTYAVNFGDLEISAANGNLFIVSNTQTSIAEFTPTGTFVQLHALPVGVSSLTGLSLDCATGTAWATNSSGIIYHLGNFPCSVADLCPGGPEPGSPCNDGNACTINDVIGLDCLCAGTFQDADSDGTCDANDLCAGGPEPGTSCNDGNACTINDVIGGDCQCAGILQDSDGDGTCDANDLCPGGPEPGTPCDDGNASTTDDVITGGCACAGTPAGGCTTDLTIDFTVGASGTLPDWELRAVGTNELVQSGTGFPMPPGTVFPVNTCVPDGHYYLTVSGAMGSGGGYVLRTSGAPGTRIIDNTANYVAGATSRVATSDGVQIPVGPNSLIHTSCDKTYWKTGEYIVANEDVDVTGQFGITMTTSGYEFWIYDPNGGYSFRKLRNHQDADGFAPFTALRACHMKINNWTAANHVPQNTLMNVRVRARVAGVNKAWGTACRFIRNEALANCPPTKLMDIPGNPYISCGATKAFNALTANRIHARPVSGATQYQFRFSLPGEGGVVVVRGNTTYYINLGWTAAQAPILQNGVTYDVDVRAMKGGVWCAWGDICKLTICNTPPCGGSMEGAGESSLMETNGTVLLWPNPNRGDQVLVTLDGLDADMQTIAVDIFDMTGKRLIARTLPAQQGAMTATLDLNGDASTGSARQLTAGMYLVNITMGGKVYTERLVIQP